METPPSPWYRRRFLLYALLAALAVFLPLPLWPSRSPLISASYSGYQMLFELFGLCAVPFFAAILAVELGRSARRTWTEAFPLLCFAAFGVYLLIYFVEYSIPTNDYGCFERGAQAVAGGRPLYEAYGYIYPPLRAQLMAAAFRAIQFGVGLAGLSVPQAAPWYAVFYFYQVVMLAAALLAWWLCYRLAAGRGLKAEHAALLITALLVANAPFLRTLRHQQINLVVLDLMLLPLFLPARWAWFSGLCLAAGAHLKLYPLLLLAPLVACRRWKLTAWFAGGLAAVALPSLGRWPEFFRFFRQFPPGEAFRDNSWHSLFYNGVHLAHRMFGLPVVPHLVRALTLLAAFLMLAWFLARLYRQTRRPVPPPLLGDIWAETLAFMLLVSPTVWEHHYVLALPLALRLATSIDLRRPLFPLAILGLLFFIPVFDVYPLSYHRLAGLLILVWYTRPRAEGSPALDMAGG